jgi:hypothetical protein
MELPMDDYQYLTCSSCLNATPRGAVSVGSLNWSTGRGASGRMNGRWNESWEPDYWGNLPAIDCHVVTLSHHYIVGSSSFSNPLYCWGCKKKQMRWQTHRPHPLHLRPNWARISSSLLFVPSVPGPRQASQQVTVCSPIDAARLCWFFNFFGGMSFFAPSSPVMQNRCVQLRLLKTFNNSIIARIQKVK